MNKAELVWLIAKDVGVSESSVERVLESMSKVIIAEVAKGGEVRLAPLAKFSVSHRAARTGRNPGTGEAIQIKAAAVPRVTPFAALKEAAAAVSAPKDPKGAPPAKKAAASTTK